MLDNKIELDEDTELYFDQSEEIELRQALFLEDGTNDISNSIFLDEESAKKLFKFLKDHYGNRLE